MISATSALLLQLALLQSSAPGLEAPVPGIGSQCDLQERILAARDLVWPALVHLEPVQELYRAGQQTKQTVTGSGVLVSEEGYIITNDHVVQGAKRVNCVLSNKEEVTARVVGRDPLTDVAVVQLDLAQVKRLPPHAELGSSSWLQVGQIVLAMGSPLGLARSLSMGVISSTDRYLGESSMGGNRPVGSLTTWIQTDAAINPGNSGGPLVDLMGRVIGINARAVPILGENLGFAIPADVVRQVSGDLIAEGRVVRSWLGVSWQHTQAVEGLLAGSDRAGVVVGGIFPGSPAARAGLEPGDLVVALDGEPVGARFEEELPAFRKRIADLPVGERVVLDVVRDDRSRRLRLRAEEMPEVETDEFELPAWGFTVRDLTRELARRMRLEDTRGALVTGVKPDGPGDEAGLRTMDVIREVAGERVQSSQELLERYTRLREEAPDSVYMEGDRGRTRRFLLLRPAYE